MKRLVGSVVGISLLTALSAFAQEKPASGPGTSGGGVSLCTITEGNKLVEKDNCEQLLDSYMRKSRVSVQELEAYKKYVGPRLAELEKILPDFAAELREAFEEKDWFMSNLKQKIPDLGKEGNGTDLPVKQRAVQYQDSDEIWADKDWYDRQPTDEQADFLWHEALVHIRLKSLEAKKKGNFGQVIGSINSDEVKFRHFVDSSPSMDDVRKMVVVLAGNSLPGMERLQKKAANHKFGLYLLAVDRPQIIEKEKNYLTRMRKACREVDDGRSERTPKAYAMGAVLHDLQAEIYHLNQWITRRDINARAGSKTYALEYFQRHLIHGDEFDLLGFNRLEKVTNCPGPVNADGFCEFWDTRLVLFVIQDESGRPYLIREPIRSSNGVYIGGRPSFEAICVYADKKIKQLDAGIFSGSDIASEPENEKREDIRSAK